MEMRLLRSETACDPGQTTREEIARLEEALGDLDGLAERMAFVHEHCMGLGLAGLRAAEDEVGRLERMGSRQRQRLGGYHVTDATLPGELENPILVGLSGYFFTSEHHEEAVRLAFRLLRCADVSDGDLVALFRCLIGCAVCGPDHYGRVVAALDGPDAGGLSDDGSLEALATCLIARGLMTDDVTLSSRCWAPAGTRVPRADEGDPEALLHARALVINRLATIADTDEWRAEVSAIALGHIGVTVRNGRPDETLRGLATATHELVEPLFPRLASLDTYRGCIDTAAFLWSRARDGADVAHLARCLSPTPTKALALALTNAICDDHAHELSLGRLECHATHGEVVGEGVLAIARSLDADGWREFFDLAFGLQAVRAPELRAWARVSRMAIATLGTQLIEGRLADPDTLDAVCGGVLELVHYAEVENAQPLVAHLLDRLGRDAGREALADHVLGERAVKSSPSARRDPETCLEVHCRNELSKWLKAYDELCVDRGVGIGIDAATSLLCEGIVLDFLTVCENQRLVGGHFAGDYLRALHEHFYGKRKAKSVRDNASRYPSLPTSPIELIFQPWDAFTNQRDQRALCQFAFNVYLEQADEEATEAAASLLSSFPHELPTLLQVLKKRRCPTPGPLASAILSMYGDEAKRKLKRWLPPYTLDESNLTHLRGMREELADRAFDRVPRRFKYENGVTDLYNELLRKEPGWGQKPTDEELKRLWAEVYYVPEDWDYNSLTWKD